MISHKTYLRRYKGLFERLQLPSGLFVNFDQFPCYWIRIRIRIPYTDPDPGKPNQYGSMQIRIWTLNIDQNVQFLCMYEYSFSAVPDNLKKMNQSFGEFQAFLWQWMKLYRPLQPYFARTFKNAHNYCVKADICLRIYNLLNSTLYSVDFRVCKGL